MLFYYLVSNPLSYFYKQLFSDITCFDKIFFPFKKTYKQR